MMKVEELRIGNWVQYLDNKIKGTVIGIKSSAFSEYSSVTVYDGNAGYTESISNEIKKIAFEPIQLKLSMLDVSAENTVEYTITKGRKSIIVRANDDERKDIFVFFEDDVGMLYCEVAFNPYVHELQNICHALIGAEPVFKF